MVWGPGDVVNQSTLLSQTSHFQPAIPFHSPVNSLHHFKMSVPDETFGYERLAKTLALDHDLSMFRRFAARNILYLQSELQSLELKLRQFDNDANDIGKGNAIWGKPRSWYWASRGQAVPNQGEEREEYWDLVLRIRELLEKYSMSVNQSFSSGDLSSFRKERLNFQP